MGSLIWQSLTLWLVYKKIKGTRMNVLAGFCVLQVQLYFLTKNKWVMELNDCWI
jgi:hypothetical protein